MQKIAIIGGGAAGMMAAATIAEHKKDCSVYLLERNKVLGRKVTISGGGRCNVTTGLTEVAEVLKKYPRGAKFLRHALYAFTPRDMYEWVEKNGVPLKVEKDLRVFPRSNHGAEIVEIFERILKSSGVNVIYEDAVKSVEKADEAFKISMSSGDEFTVDKLILTTGGQAYRHTGSTGEGYKFAENLGHSITELAPSLNSYIAEEKWLGELAGVSFEEVKLKFSGSQKHEFSGPMVITHKGVSGPAVFALSSLAAYEKVDKNNHADLFVDFSPGTTYEELNYELENFRNHDPKKLFANVLAKFAPKSLIRAFFQIVGIPESRINAEVTKKEANKVIELIKNLKLTLIEKTPGDEFVTAGGIKLDEVDSKTLESKICPNLFFAGEILNIDGFTGGYNLQAAWCSGRLAGISTVV